jgi:hypothetical protein
MAEADELIRQINSDAIKDMKEEHRLQFEVHAQNLKKIKSEVQRKSDKKKRHIARGRRRRGYARSDPGYCEGHAQL